MRKKILTTLAVAEFLAGACSGESGGGEGESHNNVPGTPPVVTVAPGEICGFDLADGLPTGEEIRQDERSGFVPMGSGLAEITFPNVPNIDEGIAYVETDGAGRVLQEASGSMLSEEAQGQEGPEHVIERQLEDSKFYVIGFACTSSSVELLPTSVVRVE